MKLPLKGILTIEVRTMTRTAATLKFIRRHYHISQQELATLLNASPRTVQHWEQGDYVPSGTAVKLIQLLAKNDAVFTELVGMKGDEGIMYLDHNDQELTILGVAFRNEREYRATLNAVVNNMYEGFEPTVADIKLLREMDNRDEPMTTQEILNWIDARDAVSDQ